jgi:hypothetical protein
MPRRPHKRTVRLVRPGLQLRLILTFGGVASLALGLQFVLFMSALARAANELPNDGSILQTRTSGILIGVFVTSFALLLPALVGIGLVMTHRIAGPVHRFEDFFERLARGERPVPLRLRKGDELQELGRLINRATAPLCDEDVPERAAAAPDGEPSAPAPERPRRPRGVEAA